MFDNKSFLFAGKNLAGESFSFYEAYEYEQNTVEADIVNKVGEYPCTLGSVILNKNKPVACANKSKLVEALFCENIQKMTGVPLDAEALQDLKH